MSVLDMIAGRLGWERVPSVKASREVDSPYTWPMWVEGPVQWTLPTLDSYTAEGYQGNAIIYACIARKAETAAVAPLRAYSGERDKPTLLADDHLLARLVRRPNRYMSWFELQELLITYLELDGNCYLYKAKPSPKAPCAGLFPIRPDYMRPVPKGGEIIGYVYERDGQRTPYMADEIIDVKYPDPTDLLDGLGRGKPPLMAAAYVGDVDNSTTKFLKQFFDNAVVPFGLLKSKQKLLDAEVNRIRARIRAQYAGMGHWGDVMILDADAEYQRLGLSMQELGFDGLDARNEARICSVLKVPPILVGAKVGLDRSTFANYGEARTSFWEDTMLPLYRRFEEQLNILLADTDFSGLWLHYDLSQVPALRKDDTAKWETAVRAFLGGVATRNEARSLAGLPPTGAEQDGFRAANEQQVGAPAITRTPPAVTGSEEAAKATAPFALIGTATRDTDGEIEERLAIERKASRRIADALDDQWSALRPETDEDVTQMETRLAAAKRPLRDAIYQALRPAALLGVSAAQRAVETIIGTAPKQIGINWTLVASYVLEWLNTYSFDLIDGIDQTTRDGLRAAMQRWVENGLPLSDLIDEIVAMGLFDRARAELIASTEITRAYAQAQIMAWQQTGVVRSMRWNTANDERVCPVCAPLGGLEFGENGAVHGSIGQQLLSGLVTDLGRPFVHPGGSGQAGRWQGHEFEAPPAHPRCRCWITAVV